MESPVSQAVPVPALDKVCTTPQDRDLAGPGWVILGLGLGWAPTPSAVSQVEWV